MRKTYYYIAGIIIMLAVAITMVFTVVRIYNSEDGNEKVTDYSADYDNENFYLVLKDETVTIYVNGDDIYDYSRLNVSDMPKEIINKLLEGYYIKGKDNLYSFLQAYSS